MLSYNEQQLFQKAPFKMTFAGSNPPAQPISAISQGTPSTIRKTGGIARSVYTEVPWPYESLVEGTPAESAG